MKLQELHANVVICTKRAEDSETKLNFFVVVQESEHNICHAKFRAAGIFGYWIAENPKGLSYFCDLTSCDLLGASIPEFTGFRDHQNGVCGRVIKRRSKLRTLKSVGIGT